jgi:GTPase SAR1 family protein
MQEMRQMLKKFIEQAAAAESGSTKSSAWSIRSSAGSLRKSVLGRGDRDCASIAEATQQFNPMPGLETNRMYQHPSLYYRRRILRKNMAQSIFPDRQDTRALWAPVCGVTCRELLPSSQAALVGIDSVNIRLTDAPGHENLDYMRSTFYRDVDFVMICFNVGSRDSFENACERWVPGLKYYSPGKQYVFVGCQKDQRRWLDPERPSYERPVISEEEGREAAKQFGALGYFECSAITGEGVEVVFEQCCGLALGWRREEERKLAQRSCLVM